MGIHASCVHSTSSVRYYTTVVNVGGTTQALREGRQHTCTNLHVGIALHAYRPGMHAMSMPRLGSEDSGCI
jgi:hypothetical protein